MMVLERPRIRLAIRIAAWACVVAIAILSLTPGDKMVRTSLSGHAEHALAYAGCGWLCLLTCRIRRHQAAIIGLLVGYAGVLEWLQLWVPGRHSGLDDFAFSSIGVAVGAVAAFVTVRLKL
jgi:VanZ family protein